MDKEYINKIKEESYKNNFEEYYSPINPSRKEIFYTGFDEGLDYLSTELLCISGEYYPGESYKERFTRLIKYITDYENNR